MELVSRQVDGRAGCSGQKPELRTEVGAVGGMTPSSVDKRESNKRKGPGTGGGEHWHVRGGRGSNQGASVTDAKGFSKVE